MKFGESEFVVTESYAAQLRARRDLFRRFTATDKALFTTLVTPNGVRANAHRDAVVDATVDASAFFAV